MIAGVSAVSAHLCAGLRWTNVPGEQLVTSAAGGWVTAAEVTPPGYLRLLRETGTGCETGGSAGGKGRNLCLGHRGMSCGSAGPR
jgi:hypothetical protein